MELDKLGYLAGVIDGEGSISINCAIRQNGKKNYRPYVSITNSNMDLLHLCKKLLEDITNKPLSIQLIDQRANLPVFRIREQSRQGVSKILNIILPLLVAKKGQAKEVLYFLGLEYGTQEQAESHSRIKTLNKNGASSNS